MVEVENAIIMAAGRGTRMRPLTYKTPKPLVKVNGVSMIETIIKALHQNSIFNITIVVGYLAEQFKYLEDKYSGIELIKNPYYEEYNNLSSLYVVKDKLANTIILDGDQIVRNPKILSRDIDYSGYAGLWTNKWVNEWIMHTDKDNRVTSCDRDGGMNGWQLFSLSRWLKRDSDKLKKLVTQAFEDKEKSLYWDDLAMFKYKDQFTLGVYPIENHDLIEIDSLDELIEIDSFDELIEIDSSYKKDETFG